jgi:integrase
VRGKSGDFLQFQGYTENVPGRCANTEPDTDHSVLYERKRGSHHYLRSGDSRKSPLQAALCSCFSTKEKLQMEKQEKRARGSGSIFQNGSAVWWIKFYSNGIGRRESSHSTDHKVAEKLLKRRLAETETKTYVPRENIRIDELVADVVSDYRVNGQKSISNVERRWKLHLMPFFTRVRAGDLTTDRVRQYINSRLAESAEAATINRELSLLKRAFNLARECTPPKVKIVPHIPMLNESNVRCGFVESSGHARLAKECARAGLWMRALLECGYSYGGRHEELLGLRVRHVDLLAGSIRLDPGTTKNDQGREVSMTQAVRVLLTECVRGKQPEDHVFTRESGQPVRNFRKRWAKVCTAAGLGELVCPKCDQSVNAERHCAACGLDWKSGDLKYVGLIFHDMRITAARNMVRAGVSEKVAMTITGHKTRSVFDRYNIVAPSDLRDAAHKLETSQGLEREALEKSQAPEFGQSLGIVAPKTGNAHAALGVAPLPN